MTYKYVCVSVGQKSETRITLGGELNELLVKL